MFDRPYLIIPTLIEQPTWGGMYITQSKKWSERPSLAHLLIGQSYELYGKSCLSVDCTDSRSRQFGPDILHASGRFDQTDGKRISLSDAITTDGTSVMGAAAAKIHGTNPVLIKYTQAKGNSFQIHKTPESQSTTWKAKPESWFYFEPGKITLGLNPATRVTDYRAVCERIDRLMQSLSEEVRAGRKTLEQAKQEAQQHIGNENPWQFVNVLTVDKNSVVDLSSGGIHHSWEEDANRFPNGNIVYEVQMDVDDASSTMRSFDQGKFKDDGSVRNIAIDDYFSFIDTDPVRNDPATHISRVELGTLFDTPYYRSELVSTDSVRSAKTGSSFVHLFMKDGVARIAASGGEVILSSGHSCLIPWEVQTYTVHPMTSPVQIIQTTLPV